MLKILSSTKYSQAIPKLGPVSNERYEIRFFFKLYVVFNLLITYNDINLYIGSDFVLDCQFSYIKTNFLSEDDPSFHESLASKPTFFKS